MSLLANSMRTFTLGERVVAAWNAACGRINPLAIIVAAWAVLTVPLVFFRGFSSEEGLAVSIARTALETGDWLTPHLFNVRWAERPTLLSWIIAAISAPFGAVSQTTARLPVAFFLLFGCLLIYWLLRKIAVSVPSALLGAALFLACPLVSRSYVTVTADMPLAVLLFFALALWWKGNQTGSIGIGGWLGIGTVLAFAGLMKGPQPLAHFALGIAAFLLAKGAWRQIPGLALAGLVCAIPLALWYRHVHAPSSEGIWAAFIRIPPVTMPQGPFVASVETFVETLPAALLAAAFLMTYGFREKRFVPPAFVAALACYAFVASALLLFWPGGSTPRSYFPAVPALCVFGGLGYETLSVRRPQSVAAVLLLTIALLAYGVAYAAVSPLMPLRFRQAEIDAWRIAALVQAAPAPIYWSDATALNLLPYLPGRIVGVSAEQLQNIQGPAWIILATEPAGSLIAQRGDKLRAVMPLGAVEQWRLLRLDS